MTMVSVAEAKKHITENTSILIPALQPLDKATGLVLSNDIIAPIDIPRWPQSSMDGYAINFTGWQQHKKLKVDFVVAAGQDQPLQLTPDKAARIFTGAAVPAGADTVVMQEKSNVVDGELIIEDANLKLGDNLRPKGSEISTGTLALPEESLLTPAATGFLAGLGITEVYVYPKPVVSIIVTGNELQQPGQPLKHGQVYESNSFTLKAALEQLHISDVKIYYAEDNLEKLSALLNTVLSESDIVLMTGGISVGDYDFVLNSTQQNGVHQVFHKIKQRPGKPIYFGVKDKKLVFGLPGNPASVLTCFYEYVCLAIEKMTLKKCGVTTIKAPMGSGYRKTAGLTHFLKGYYDGSKVNQLDAQESFRLSSFARANCLIVIPEENTETNKEEMVEVHLLPV